MLINHWLTIGLGARYAYSVFYPAVVIVALACGFNAGLSATILLALYSFFWLLAKPVDSSHAVRLGLFVFSGVLTSGVAGLYRRSRSALEEAAERNQMQEALQQSRRDLAEDLESTSRLQNLAARYVGEHDLEGILQEIVEAAIAITHADKGNLQFYDPAAGGLRISAAKGFSNDWLGFFGFVHREGASCAEAMRSRKRVIVEDVRSSSIFEGKQALDVQLKEGIRAVQSTPLFSRSGEFLGMLSTHFSQPHRPRERELHWLDLLARQAADLLERRRAEAALREREAVLRTVTTEARVGLVMIDRERRYLFANQTYADILRLPNADLAGKSVADVLAHVYDQVKPHLDRAFNGERVTYELTVPALLRAGEQRIYEVVYQPRTDSIAEPYVVVVIADITERKRMQQTLELTVTDRTARLRETVHDLEAFSYSIAHDMRAPLRAMQGFSNMLEEQYGEQLRGSGQEYLRRIAASANRMDQLIQDVLDYSKIVRSEVRLEPVPAREFIQQIVESYPNLHPPQAQIQIEGPMPRVLANPAAFTQVISNLLGNAVKFVKAGIKPQIRVWSEERNGSGLVPIRAAPERERQTETEHGEPAMVRLWFEDNGIGIRKEAQDRIFMMFQRLNPADKYEGTGIGLAIVRKAVERMGGRVGVESEPGRGSRFWVELKEAA